MRKLEDLKGLNKGLQKQWIWGNKDNYYRSCDYQQKINYCIQDLNAEIENLSEASMKDIVFVIVLIDWICEAVNSIQKLLLPDINKGFIYTYKNGKEIKKAEEYFRAIRSFVVAHPLNTDRHKDYGLDGDLICVDIRRRIPEIISTFTHDGDWFHLSLNGKVECAKDLPFDFVLCTYSQKSDRMQFFKYIGANFSDLFFVAEQQIEKLYALNKYLVKLSRKEMK